MAGRLIEISFTIFKKFVPFFDLGDVTLIVVGVFELSEVRGCCYFRDRGQRDPGAFLFSNRQKLCML